MLTKDLRNRLISAVLILILMVSMVFINGYVLLLGVLALSLIAIYELKKALSKIGADFIVIPAYLFNIVFILNTYFGNQDINLPLLSLYIVALLVVMIFIEKISLVNVISNSFIAIYITLSYSYFIVIREPMWLFFLFGISSVTDTFAYFFGVLFGKHKLYEKLSPKKTIEGSLGGIFGAVVFAIIFTLIYDIEISTIIVISITVFMSILSQIGDLIASYIKRKANIKDYGKIFIGHGGVMDRFDSILLILPVLAMLLKLV
ncbi:MAG: phosphatidate cytidylyltransferase [Tissierellia bacterium]|nr:phosphatidate cytidylyltransferase [Tissierellia bacterium]